MRINFYAGACAGKTTTAAWLFSELKLLGHSVEYVNEYVKKWAYLKRLPRSFDQLAIFGKQSNAEDIALTAGVQNIVSDSPLHLSHIYAKHLGNEKVAFHLEGLANCFEETFPSVSVYLERGDKEYKPEGRFGSLEDAIQIDQKVKDYLLNLSSPVCWSNWRDRDRILDFALTYISK